MKRSVLALRNLQQTFYDAVMERAGGEEALLAAIEEDGEAGRRRLAAYRRSILGNLGGALLATYPVVARIVGLPFFHQAARCYIAAHPSYSGDLNEYGGEFAAFLQDYPYARELAYLPDVARLEWLVQMVYYAADSAPADLSALAEARPEHYGDLCFAVAPACARIDSIWPLHEIWRVNAEAYEGEMAVDFSLDCRALIRRRDGLVQVEPLSPGDAALFDAIAGGASLAAATNAALAIDSGFDLVPALRRWAADGVLIGACLSEPTGTGNAGDSHGQP